MKKKTLTACSRFVVENFDVLSLANQSRVGGMRVVNYVVYDVCTRAPTHKTGHKIFHGYTVAFFTSTYQLLSGEY